jgi:hypothetical protein
LPVIVYLSGQSLSFRSPGANANGTAAGQRVAYAHHSVRIVNPGLPEHHRYGVAAFLNSPWAPAVLLVEALWITATGSLSAGGDRRPRRAGNTSADTPADGGISPGAVPHCTHAAVLNRCAECRRPSS